SRRHPFPWASRRPGSRAAATPPSRRSTVSLLWGDQVRIGVAPNRLIAAGYQRGVNPRLVRRDIVEVEPGNSGPGWQAAIEAVPAALAPFRAAKTERSVLLSKCFVRA